MLYLHHPDSDKTFKAAGLAGRIGSGCGKYILQDYAERQDTFLEMEIACDAFLEFCKEHYKKEYAGISKNVEEIRSEIGRLAAIHEETDEGCCKVCNTQLESIDPMVSGFSPFHVCPSCPQLIRASLNDIDYYTGAFAI
jgi:Zn finger protein HypA/HybF involved in hydrogenase expression